MKLWGIIVILFLIGGCIEEKATLEPEIDGHGSISGKVLKVTQKQYSNCNHYMLGNITQVQSFTVPFSILTSGSFISSIAGINGNVTVHIRANNASGREITNLTENLGNLTENAWEVWDFPDAEVDNSTTYYAVFECPNCDVILSIPEAPLPPLTNIICFWYEKSDVYPNGSYWYDGTPYSEWDLAFEFNGY